MIDYKVDTQNFIVFLHTKNSNVNDRIFFTIRTQKKFLGITISRNR